MAVDDSGRLLRLCEQASQEHDHDKLIQLAEEAIRLLDEEKKELQSKRETPDRRS